MSRRRRITPFVRQQNPTQSRDSVRAWTRTAAVAGVAGLAAAAFAAPAQAKPDTGCMQAGMAALRGLPSDSGAGALDDVARFGLPISTAVALKVEPRPGTDVGSLPDPLPLNVVLADHRAGDKSLFIYPWCE
jgi:hypothetical protein